MTLDFEDGAECVTAFLDQTNPVETLKRWQYSERLKSVPSTSNLLIAWCGMDDCAASIEEMLRRNASVEQFFSFRGLS